MYINKRNAKKKTPKYIESIYRRLRCHQGITKNIPPQQDLIQSTKSIIEEGPRPINKLNHTQRLHKKLSLIIQLECSLFLNALLFLSFQIVQKKAQKGRACHTLFLFLTQKRLVPTCEHLSHWRGKNPRHQKRENRRCQHQKEKRCWTLRHTAPLPPKPFMGLSPPLLSPKTTYLELQNFSKL